MTEQPQTSGVDMARAAFRAARAAAKNQPMRKPRRTSQTSQRRTDDRDPIGLGAAILKMMTEHGWEAPATGGSLINQWPTLVPELADTVQPVAYDANTGRLDLRPCSPAHATQLRLTGAQLVQRINTALGKPAVRTIRVLPPGPIQKSAPGRAPAPTSAAAPRPAPVTAKPHLDGSDGYRRALAAHHEHAVTDHRDPAMLTRIDAAARAQTEALLQHREPEIEHRDAVWAQDTTAKQASRGNDPEERRQAAIRMARAQKAGYAPTTPTVRRIA